MCSEGVPVAAPPAPQAMYRWAGVTAFHCPRCERVTFVDGGYTRDTCECGNEFYPVSKSVAIGKAYTFEELKGT